MLKENQKEDFIRDERKVWELMGETSISIYPLTHAFMLKIIHVPTNKTRKDREEGERNEVPSSSA